MLEPGEGLRAFSQVGLEVMSTVFPFDSSIVKELHSSELIDPVMLIERGPLLEISSSTAISF